LRALIDADILLYRVGYTTETENETIAQWRMEELIHRILETTEAESFAFYLSDGRLNTFRAKLNSLYKANRTQPKPKHYEFLKNYLIDIWAAEVAVNQEADDLLGIEQTKDLRMRRLIEEEPMTIICSIDKDLLQIPGHHYNFVKDVFTDVSPEEGLLFFYKQLLIGDVADNIKGVTGIGEKKAGYILDEMLGEPEEEIFLKVQETYRNWLEQEWADTYEEWGDFQEKQMNNIILLNGIMLKIRTEENQIWNIPKECNLRPEVTPTLDSTTSQQVELSEPIVTEVIG
jgi:5'-3' exonuclease